MTLYQRIVKKVDEGEDFAYRSHLWQQHRQRKRAMPESKSALLDGVPLVERGAGAKEVARQRGNRWSTVLCSVVDGRLPRGRSRLLGNTMLPFNARPWPTSDGCLLHGRAAKCQFLWKRPPSKWGYLAEATSKSPKKTLRFCNFAPAISF